MTKIYNYYTWLKLDFNSMPEALKARWNSNRSAFTCNINYRTLGRDGKPHWYQKENIAFDEQGRSEAVWVKSNHSTWEKAKVNEIDAAWNIKVDGCEIWDHRVEQMFRGEVKNQYNVAKLDHKRIAASCSRLMKDQPNQQDIAISRDSEVILVVGTEQHSSQFGDKMMFPAQAVREVRENYSTYKHTTIIIFKDGWTPMQLSIIKRDVKNFNLSLYFKVINSTSELISYMNNGDSTVSRENLKIGTIKIFSHGLPSVFDFGLDGPNSTVQRLGISDVAKLQKSAFNNKPTIMSYACRIGNSDGRSVAALNTYNYDSNWQSVVKPEESLAQILSNHLNATVYAYLRRTLYKSTWDVKDDLSMTKDNMTITDDAATTFKDAKRVVSSIISGKRIVYGEVLWNPRGAVAPPISGDTPKGLPSARYIFNPNQPPVPE